MQARRTPSSGFKGLITSCFLLEGRHVIVRSQTLFGVFEPNLGLLL